MTALDRAVAISSTVSAFRFFSCVNMLNDSSSKSCSIPREALVQNSLVMCIGAPGKKNHNSQPQPFAQIGQYWDGTPQKFAHFHTASAVLTAESFDAVGITRKTLPAKVDPAIVEWLDFLVHAVHPLKQTRSSLIAMFLTELQERFAAGDLTGMPKVLQGALGASSYTEKSSMGTEPLNAEGMAAPATARSANRVSPAMETVPLPPQSIHPSSKKRLA